MMGVLLVADVRMHAYERQSFEDQASGLNERYEELANTHFQPESQEIWQEYFDFFPDNFERFVLIFGLEELESDELYIEPLYEDSYRFINTYFLARQFVNMDEFVAKTIALLFMGNGMLTRLIIFKGEHTGL